MSKFSNLAVHRKLNWRPSKPRLGLPQYEKLPEAVQIIPYPTTIDLRDKQSPVFDQTTWGSCAGASTKSAEEYLQLLDIRDKIVTPEVFNPLLFEPVSAAMLYTNARIIEGDVAEDNGAEIFDVINGLVTKGVCREVTWPYIDANILKVPSATAYAEASKHKLRFYYAIEDGNIEEMRRCLYHGFPFIFGFTVYTSFMTEEVAKTGIITMPNLKKDVVVGGHAVCAVGFNDSRKIIIVKNSWSKHWGIGGYFLIPYDYISSANLCADFWTIRRNP